MNICFDVFGCRLNKAEALEDEARALGNGHKIVKTHAEADLIVIRGCSVTGRAQHDCEQEIARLKAKYPAKRIWIAGCLKDAKPLVIKRATGAESGSPGVPMRTARAYLKVQDGCNSACTFCIVPKFRGKSRATAKAEVLDKARRFIAAGYQELVLTGCNLCQYPDFPGLVAELCELYPKCRVRLGSVEPGSVAERLVELMSSTPNLCRFLHLSIQSGSQMVLNEMRRPYSSRQVDALLAKAVALMPDIGLGCDLIAGFPGETELDFGQSASLITRFGIVNVHAFPYSERPGTLAAAMRGQLPREVRRERARQLAQLGERNRTRLLRKFVGKTVAVVAETRGDKQVAGWTGEYLWCEGVALPGSAQKPPGGTDGYRRQLLKIKVGEVTARGLKGVIL